ncbi:MAG: aspartate 1-decarboxylase [Phycisphaerales bacterium]
MIRQVLHSKIHMPAVTGAHPDYMGSITIDAELLDACGMRVNDVVLIGNCRTGARFETYIFRGEPGSRKIEINGAAAHLVEVGDRLIILHFAWMDDAEYADHHPTVLLMNADNTVHDTIHYDPSPTSAVTTSPR